MNLSSAVPIRRIVVAVVAATFARASSAGAQAESVKYISNTAIGVDVILVAHQDDWQLFMGDVALRQIRKRSEVVVIYLTAGDDGRDSVYWRTREQGALESTRVAIGMASIDSVADRCSIIEAREHSIRKCTMANTQSYFLRLPDGRRSGLGFAGHSYESLRKLRGKRINSISAVDGSTRYNSWEDLKLTVGVLVGASSADRSVTVRTSDPNVLVNPHDHFDHRMAGLLIADSRRQNGWNVVYYAGYALATRAANRTKNQARQKAALFLAYDTVMTQVNPSWSAYREHPGFYSECMLRTYGRTIRITR